MVIRRRSPRFFSNISPSPSNTFKQSLALLLGSPGFGQQTPPPTPQARPQPDSQQTTPSKPMPPTTVTVPAGTSLALVLTHPIQSRYIHRGDDVYAQIVSPITSGNEVVIPAGTLVNGKFDKLGRHGNRGQLYLQSMSIAFPDGYVAPVPGPIMLESNEGYAWKDPGSGRITGLIIGPLAGAGLGALIGHSVASSQPTTLTNTLPAGCTGPPPECLTSSVTVPPDKGKDTMIGAAVGSGIGVVAGLLLVGTSHHFFLDVGTPVEMTLQHPLTLQEDQVSEAVQDAEQHPVPQQPIAPRPRPVPPPPGNNTGICWTPGTPATPDIDIPGTPPIGDSPGTPAVHIPGTPGTPPTSYPCP
jgi:hypothetical protein